MIERFATLLSTFTLSFDNLQQLSAFRGIGKTFWNVDTYISLSRPCSAEQGWYHRAVPLSSPVVLSEKLLLPNVPLLKGPTSIQLRRGELRYRTWQLPVSGPCIIPSLVLCQPRCAADVCLGLQDAGCVCRSISSKPLSHRAAEQAWKKRRWLWLVPIRVQYGKNSMGNFERVVRRKLRMKF